MSVGEYLERITPFGFSGACLVGVGDEIVLNAGYGLAVLDQGLENTPETVFSLGSVTKQFTAAAVLKLQEGGVLGVDDPIGLLLDAAPPDKAGITLHQLLTHTSGLPTYTGDDFEPADRDETLARMLGAPLRSSPGAEYAYSNAGYSLPAAIIELATGEGYEEFLQRELLHPAGLESTGYRLPAWDGRVVAHWYRGGADNGTPLEKPYPSWNLLGNGDMLSTTEDMWRWHLALKDDTVLSASSRNELFTPHVGDYAYGWRVLDGARGRAVEHDGASSYGSSCAVKRFLDADVFLVLFCNASYGASPLAQVVEDRVVAAASGEEVRLPPRPRPQQSFDSVAGLYVLPSGSRVRVAGAVIAAEGQDAIDELAFGGSSHADLNERALRVASSVLAGDDAPLRLEVSGDEQRLERYRRMIGALEGSVSVAGTMPSHLSGVLATYVRAGDGGITLYWRDRQLLGLGEGDPDAAYSVTLARADSGYVAYDLRARQIVWVDFESHGLSLFANARRVRAERL